jgi:branched-chain amino acid transport system ATP-binding protein
MSEQLLELQAVSRRFGGLHAVEEVSLTIAAGERVGLIGPNGAGKTTLFALIAGELEIDAGSISLEGRRVDPLPPNRRARLGIARTYQRLEVFPEMTVLEHLLVALSAHRGSTGILGDLLGRGRSSDQDLEQAHAMLERLGIDHLADDVVGTLSLGTCRLVELARALVVRPTLLLADEPSSGLDSFESAELAELLVDLSVREGIAIALVEHDLVTVRAVCDRVIVLDLGRVIAQGSYDEVMDVDAVRRAYLGASR